MRKEKIFTEFKSGLKSEIITPSSNFPQLKKKYKNTNSKEAKKK